MAQAKTQGRPYSNWIYQQQGYDPASKESIRRAYAQWEPLRRGDVPPAQFSPIPPAPKGMTPYYRGTPIPAGSKVSKLHKGGPLRWASNIAVALTVTASLGSIFLGVGVFPLIPTIAALVIKRLETSVRKQNKAFIAHHGTDRILVERTFKNGFLGLGRDQGLDQQRAATKRHERVATPGRSLFDPLTSARSQALDRAVGRMYGKIVYDASRTDPATLRRAAIDALHTLHANYGRGPNDGHKAIRIVLGASVDQIEDALPQPGQPVTMQQRLLAGALIEQAKVVDQLLHQKQQSDRARGITVRTPLMPDGWGSNDNGIAAAAIARSVIMGTREPNPVEGLIPKTDSERAAYVRDCRAFMNEHGFSENFASDLLEATGKAGSVDLGAAYQAHVDGLPPVTVPDPAPTAYSFSPII